MPNITDRSFQSTVPRQSDFGVVAWATSIWTTPNGAGTNIGAAEHAGLLTLTVPTDGLYRLGAHITMLTSSNAATSDMMDALVSYVDPIGARSNLDLSLAWEPQHTMSAKVANNVGSWQGLHRLSGLNPFVIKLRSVVTGAKTAGVAQWSVYAERVAP